MHHFEDCLFDLVGETTELLHHFEQQVEIFADQIRQHGWKRPIKIWDAGGKSSVLPLGLSLYGYEVSTVCGEHVARKLPALGSRLRTQVKWGASIQQAKVDVVVAAQDALADYRTEMALQQVLGEFAETLITDGLLLVATRDYDQLLRTRPRSNVPQILTTQRGHCIRLLLWKWSGSDCTYTANQYLIGQTGDNCTVHHRATNHRAWRRAEINLALAQAHFTEIQWQTFEHDGLLVRARKA